MQQQTKAAPTTTVRSNKYLMGRLLALVLGTILVSASISCCQSKGAASTRSVGAAHSEDELEHYSFGGGATKLGHLLKSADSELELARLLDETQLADAFNRPLDRRQPTSQGSNTVHGSSTQEHFSGQARTFVRRSAAATNLQQQHQDQELSSADLPAEFRGAADSEQAPQLKEQSRLARLCRQTSSVLASVLPAPFGGHKRSILCQFFGQLSMADTNSKPSSSAGLASASFIRQPESVAILQQPPRPPVALLPAGRHPIQLVLEQHQRQQTAGFYRAPAPPAPPMPPAVSAGGDLLVSASIAEHHRVKAPPLMLKPSKFSQPVPETNSAKDSFRPLVIGKGAFSSPVTGANWRIFEPLPGDLLPLSSSQQPVVNATTATPSSLPKLQDHTKAKNESEPNNRPLGRLVLSKLSAMDPSKQVGDTNSSSIVMSSSTISSTSIGKRTSETLKTAVTKPLEQQVLQVSSTTSSSIPIESTTSANKTTAPNPDTSTTAPSSSSSPSPQPPQADGQLQQNSSERREELVIASINNLTRIAFGNQLRDTVKVINRLIDQQSSLFGEQQAKKPHGDPGKSVAPRSESKSAKQSLLSGRHPHKSISNSARRASSKKQTSGSGVTRSRAPKKVTSAVKQQSIYLASESRRLSSLSNSTPSAKSISRSLSLDYGPSTPFSSRSTFQTGLDNTPWRQVTTSSPLLWSSGSNELWSSASNSDKKMLRVRHLEPKQQVAINLLSELKSEPYKSSTKKMDSLSTLKMLLATSTMEPKQTTIPTGKPVGHQSRWVPSGALTTISMAPSTTTTTTTTSTTTTTTSNPTTLSPSTVKGPNQTSKQTNNDLNEVRASDIISKYTTHLNEANELLATTRRFFNQPSTQIANTGEFFSAETISSWPERYQTRMDQQRLSTVAMETTRRNGDSYESSVSRPSRHRADSIASGPILPATGQPSSGVTVLPSNHKLSTLPADLFSSASSSIETTLAKQTTPIIYRLPDQQQASTSLPPQPSVTESTLLVDQQQNNQSTHLLKAPYSEPAAETNSSEPISRKLYQLLAKNLAAAVAQRPIKSYLNQIASTGANHSDYSATRNTTDRLIDLIGNTQASSYYDLLQNQNQDQSNASSWILNGDEEKTSSLFGKTGAILNELRQLERKRAAAILAAIRYQVPAPLARPWDSSADLLSKLRNNEDTDQNTPTNHRMDNNEQDLDESDLNLWTGFLFGPARSARSALRSALQRQRLVSRDELEARLGGSSGSANMEDRSDYVAEQTSNQTVQVQGVKTGEHSFPKYLRLNDYQTASSVKPDNLRTKSRLSLMLDSSSLLKSNLDRIKSNLASHQTVNSSRVAEMNQQQPVVETDQKSHFDCSDRQAGFYPDSRSACRTFYHCSSTGHLLSFDCPRETRFDERTLNCGPWFEVPCDLSRTRRVG